MRAWKSVLNVTSYTNTSYFLYDGSQLVCEFNGGANLKATNVWGANGLVSRQNGNATSPMNWYLWDDRGSMAHLLNSDGSVAVNSNVSSWGAITADSSYRESYSGLGGQFGNYLDIETGLTLCGQRYYDANAGRWFTRDPIGTAGGLNVYAYVENNPVNEMDPDGLVSYKRTYPPAKTALDKLRRANPGWNVTRAYKVGGGSGLTHDVQPCGGSVAFDISARGHDSGDILEMLKALPKYGFVGWYRPWYEKGEPHTSAHENFHIHMVYSPAKLSHGGNSPGGSAGRQVDDWIKGGDGLSGRPYRYRGRYDNEKPVSPWTQKQIDIIREGHNRFH